MLIFYAHLFIINLYSGLHVPEDCVFRVLKYLLMPFEGLFYLTL